MTFSFSTTADGNETRSFTTYKNYVEVLALVLTHIYGVSSADRYANIFGATNALCEACTSIHKKSLTGAEKARLEKHVKNALSSLICLEHDAFGQDFIEVKNAWTPAQAWYAVHHALTALAVFTVPTMRLDHDSSTREAAKLIVDRKLLPFPWSAYITQTWDSGSVATPHNFRSAPTSINQLEPPTLGTFDDYLALMLKTTGDKKAERKFEIERKKKPRPGRTRRNVSASVKKRVYEKLGATTIFDMLYRLRTRANYGAVDTFVVGCASISDAQKFAQNLEFIADATIAVIEAVIVAYAGEDLYAKTLKDFASRHPYSDVIKARLACHK